MTGDQKSHESHVREPRSSRPSSGQEVPESRSQPKSRGRRTGGNPHGGRKSLYTFGDQLEHDMCQLVTHQAPKGFPVNDRPELATIPPVEVARGENRILYCDGLHAGPHIWPSGDEVS